ncbi:hypothetical protein A3F00_03950 [Candidatus Daviesbacteria bacterium RIFCSPHIGHO2_12_FULL_37_11]|uniref:Uncharacterized protein n=1 Tax=Candidatus Daviesbacteria bacterium RIFCSPHIGHO2_12_FULL_37_11 TaxID=1797777 RepID=A0A1F5KB10_9BACT|nr:MAG: hypothetical protein A2769_01855 [Candidatus Daviesbacteria bacterium RIFCSPHIGHO2_01_FULL_37_27]OGE38143.1 MAG: hypothetical protein A3F00_03950 [Candidatus Daviesbacteria bacterium RIFCSPHIGHO2_12_FULL_37_11]OGE45346.1 MAG: hypothetical protein A3B39_01395 [Candidatus Daviesbacteria bacterium RIFCSPLOWO2_01_FULL_37_10]
MDSLSDLFFVHTPRLSDSQFKVLSEISADIGQVFFASTVVSPFLLGVDRINWFVVIFGGILSLLFWSLAIILVGKDKA